MRRAERAALAIAALLMLSGCSSSIEPPPVPSGLPLAELEFDDADRNGLEFLEGEAALDAVLAAARRAGSVTMSGTVTERVPPPEGQREPVDGETVTVTFDGSARDFDASVRVGAIDGRFRVSGDTVLAAGSPAFGLIHGVEMGSLQCVAAEKPDHRHWRPILDPWELLAELTAGEGDEGVTIGVGAVIGDDVQLFLGAGDSAIGTLTVSATGQPLPKTIVAADASGSGTLSFANWGAVELEPPVETCDSPRPFS